MIDLGFRHALPPAAKKKIVAILGAKNCLDKPADLKLYEYDGSVDTVMPDMVVFPRTTEEVAAVVKVAAEYGVPLVGRGAGTGLSGGAIPRAGGLTIAFSRMN